MPLQNVESVYPLSPLQQGLLFHSLAAPESDVYFNQCVFTLRGELDVEVFRRCWQEVTQNHGALRTFFVWEDLAEPVQVVQATVAVPFQVLDWRSVSPSQRQDQLKSKLNEIRVEGFDLTHPPLMRCDLAKTDRDRYVFIWSHHHLLLDGWSMFHVLGDVFARYDSIIQGQSLPQSSPRPYRDYIAHLNRQDQELAKPYWQNLLSGYTPAQPLSLDGGPQTDFLSVTAGSSEEIRLSESATGEIQSFARGQRVTVNTVIQLAWGLLLSRYYDSSDILFGSVVSGRPPELDGFQDMVGLFINTLPVRLNMTGEDRCGDALNRMQQQQTESRQFEFTPLMQIQRWSDIPGDRQLFESLLMFENYRKEQSIEEMVRSLQIEDVQWIERSQYPLTLIAIPEMGFCFRMVYDNRRFNAQSIRRILMHLRQLLEGIVRGANQLLGEIPMITTTERQQLLDEWNATSTDFPGDESIHSLFEGQVDQYADSIAVDCAGEQLSYRELNERANQLAHFLVAQNISSQEIVGICMERGPAMIVAMLAILKAGGAYLPLDPEFPAQRLAGMIDDAGVSIVITDQESRPHIPATPARIVCLDSCHGEMGEQSRDNPGLSLDGSTLAYAIYTSGSTGRPKGTAVEHRAVIRLIMETDYVDLDAKQRIAQVSTASFDAATFEIWGALLHGGTIVGVDRMTALAAADFAAWLKRERITTLFLTTALFNQIAREEPTAFDSLDQLLFGGEAVDPTCVRTILEQGPPRRLLHVYGPTECTTFATCFTVEAVPANASTVPIGRPIANTKAFILDNAGQPAAIGIPGELHLGGPGLARGYLNQPQLTDEKFITLSLGDRKERLYRTGDICRFLSDGNIEFIGRRDRQIKLRGFRIELGEIELALNDHETVQQSVVIAATDSSGTKLLAAYVVPQPGREFDVNTIQDYLRSRLPAYMLPHSCLPMDEFPLNANGKVDQQALPSIASTSREIGEDFVAPQSQLERAIAETWQRVLEIEGIGLNDNFFDLGGHSLKVMQVYGQLRKKLANEFSVVDLFQYPTVRSLACHLGGNTQPEPAMENAQRRAQMQRNARARRRQIKRGGQVTND